MRQAAFVSSLECLPKHDLIGLLEVLEAQGVGGLFPLMVDTGSLRPKGVP